LRQGEKRYVGSAARVPRGRLRLSLQSLHRQLVAAKASELAIARDLSAQAYEPARTGRPLEALDRQHSLLGAAEATSVIAITLARLILDAPGV